MMRMLRRVAGWLTRSTLRLTIIVSIVVLSLGFNAAVLAVDAVRDAVVQAVSEIVDGRRKPSPRKPKPPQPDLDRLRADNDRLRAERDDLARRVNRVDADLVSERQARRQMIEKGRDITDRIAQRTARSITANFGSMAAEAVPVAGVLVIAGVTFYEVREACGIMSDMRELSTLFDDAPPEENRYCGYSLKEFRDVVFNPPPLDCTIIDMPPEMVAACPEIPPPDSPNPGDPSPPEPVVLPDRG